MTAKHEFRGEGLVFLVGAPRSGTTWLQKMLACLPDVATGQESDIFDQYIGPQMRHWRRDLDASTSGRSAVGLGCYLTQDQYFAALDGFMQELLAPIIQAIPRDGVFVEKTPSHALFLPEIHQMLPQAKIIHMIRDCRDVCSSLMAASQSWGSYWAPSRAGQAARMWVSHVHSARAAGRGLPDGLYYETTYEMFKETPESALGELVAWLGMDTAQGAIASAVARNAADSEDKPDIPVGGEWARRSGSEVVREPQGFVRKARAGSWKEDLGLWDRLVIWRVARREMAACGYDWPIPF